MNRLRKTTVLCVCSFLTVYMLFQHVFYLGYVPSTSMEPTIRQGSYILGTRLVSSLRRGDIIVFSHEHQTLTKRIAYVPGDVLPDGTIVPDDFYYVLGDNRSASLDSRFWEKPFVSRRTIIAKYIF